MNIRPSRETAQRDNCQSPPTQARFARAYFLPRVSARRVLTGLALAQPRTRSLWTRMRRTPS